MNDLSVRLSWSNVNKAKTPLAESFCCSVLGAIQALVIGRRASTVRDGVGEKLGFDVSVFSGVTVAVIAEGNADFVRSVEAAQLTMNIVARVKREKAIVLGNFILSILPHHQNTCC
jgi:hypothetical protein